MRLPLDTLPNPIPLLLPMAALALPLIAVPITRSRWAARFLHRIPKTDADGHPLCYHCGYSQNGLPDSSLRCPECGQSRDASFHSIVEMNRRVRRLRTLLVCLAFIPFAWFTVRLGAWARQIETTPWKSTGTLLRQAASRTDEPRDLALIELIKRFADGQLTAQEASSVARACVTFELITARPRDCPDDLLLYVLARCDPPIEPEWMTQNPFAGPCSIEVTFRVRTLSMDGVTLPLANEEGTYTLNSFRFRSSASYAHINRATIDKTDLRDNIHRVLAIIDADVRVYLSSGQTFSHTCAVNDEFRATWPPSPE